MDEDIQIQAEFRLVKRVFVAPQPRTYSELLDLINTNVKKVDITSCCLLYENDEGDFIVLPKDNFSLSVAIRSSKRIPGVDLLRLKLQVLETTSPSGTDQVKGSNVSVENLTSSFSTGMKELSPAIVSPAAKRGRFISSTREPTTMKSKKHLSFESSVIIDNSAQETDANSDKQCKTPLTRYIEKTEGDLAAEEESLNVLYAERDSITKRIEKVKNHQLQGNLCSKCHLRLGHTARNCNYGSCDSVFSCGEQKFHVGEVNTKELDIDIRKKEKRVQLLNSELENRKAACKSVKESLARQIEADVFEVNSDGYMFYGQKNWSLLRKHVHAVEQYCKCQYNGKLPGKKDLKFVLKKALEGSSLFANPSSIRARQRHENPAISVLETCGIKFLSASRVGSSSSCSFSSATASYEHCIPASKEEEDAQVQTALIESRFIAGDLAEKPLNSVPVTGKLRPNTCEQSDLSSDTDDETPVRMMYTIIALKQKRTQQVFCLVS